MMKKIRAVSAYFFVIGLGAMLASAVTCKAAWEGVDKNVVEKFAEQAGRPARKPLIHTDQGDLLLFVFLLAGITGGFIGGYFFRGLFASPQRARPEGAQAVC